ncbi:MAG: hypothetical protein ACXAC2_20995, partial [Candidatus Kariarchaeaceae archaeon]
MNLDLYLTLKPYFYDELSDLMELKTSNIQLNQLLSDIKQQNDDQTNGLLLQIRKLLWNEEVIVDTEDLDMILVGTLLLWKSNQLDIVDLKVMINQIQINERLKDESLIFTADLISKFSEAGNLDRWLENMMDQLYDLGNYLPRLTNVIDTYKLIHGEIDPQYNSLASLVDSLFNRPEYFTELVEFRSSE